MNFKEELIKKINRLLEGKITVPEFHDEYYMFFVKEAGKDLTVDDNLFFGDIQEKLDYVVENPEKEDREVGYINYEEYINWLKGKMENLPE